MKSVRVLLADDQKLVRAGIRALLERFDGVEVIGEAGDGSEAIRLSRSILPDVVLIDIVVRGASGIEIAAQISEECPQVRALILSRYAGEEYAICALRAGVSGYLVKSSDAVELEQALRTVANGEKYLSPSISKIIAANYTGMNRARGRLHGALTPRQREVLKLIAEGQSTKEVAHLLRVSVKTVETHRAELMSRLEIYNLAGLIHYAIRIGLISIE